MKFATVFEYANAEKIPEARPAHRAYLTELRERGKLVASGPFEDDSGALIIYEADSVEEAEELIRHDPFREAGVFARWTIKPWKQVF